jgi:hypothetical protein
MLKKGFALMANEATLECALKSWTAPGLCPLHLIREKSHDLRHNLRLAQNSRYFLVLGSVNVP